MPVMTTAEITAAIELIKSFLKGVSPRRLLEIAAGTTGTNTLAPTDVRTGAASAATAEAGGGSGGGSGGGGGSSADDGASAPLTGGIEPTQGISFVTAATADQIAVALLHHIDWVDAHSTRSMGADVLLRQIYLQFLVRDCALELLKKLKATNADGTRDITNKSISKAETNLSTIVESAIPPASTMATIIATLKTVVLGATAAGGALATIGALPGWKYDSIGARAGMSGFTATAGLLFFHELHTNANAVRRAKVEKTQRSIHRQVATNITLASVTAAPALTRF